MKNNDLLKNDDVVVLHPNEYERFAAGLDEDALHACISSYECYQSEHSNPDLVFTSASDFASNLTVSNNANLIEKAQSKAGRKPKEIENNVQQAMWEWRKVYQLPTEVAAVIEGVARLDWYGDGRSDSVNSLSANTILKLLKTEEIITTVSVMEILGVKRVQASRYVLACELCLRYLPAALDTLYANRVKSLRAKFRKDCAEYDTPWSEDDEEYYLQGVFDNYVIDSIGGSWSDWYSEDIDGAYVPYKGASYKNIYIPMPDNVRSSEILNIQQCNL